MFHEFAKAADEDGLLDHDAFSGCFRALIGRSGESEARTRAIIDRLFSLFDADGNGVVDFTELGSGLSVLCGGPRDDKVQAAFSLFDVNGDGFITKEEMRTYLTSVFRVLYETQPDIRDRIGVGPEELGNATAEQAFADADLNHDGKISYAEFQKWYVAGGSKVDEMVPDDISLELVRELTNLHEYDVMEVFDMFAAHADDDGLISRRAFYSCFQQLVEQTGDPQHHKAEKLSVLLGRLFAIFDQDGSGSIDFAELASGMSVLCGGSREAKVKAAFALYDVNGDGFISVRCAAHNAHPFLRFNQYLIFVVVVTVVTVVAE